MATKKEIKIIVEPATDNADKEGYVKVNGKVFPFGIPMKATENDIRTIKNIKEPKKPTSTGVDVKAIMNQLRISQEKANKVAREYDKDGINPNAQVRWKNKYFVRMI